MYQQTRTSAVLLYAAEEVVNTFYIADEDLVVIFYTADEEVGYLILLVGITPPEQSQASSRKAVTDTFYTHNQHPYLDERKTLPFL